MKRNASEVWVRLRAAVLTTLCIAAAGSALVATPAVADEEPAATELKFTVHVTRSSQDGGSQNPDGLILPEEQQPDSAGAGFVYQLIHLDADKVAGVEADTPQDRTNTVLASIEDYLLDDPDVQEIYGESNDDGTITNDGEAGVGSWVTGATLTTSGSLDLADAAAATLPGTQDEPSYWYLKLVGYPAGLKPTDGTETSGDGLVSLPYQYSTDDVDSDEINYDVHVYPKTSFCTTDGTEGFEACPSEEPTTPPEPEPEPGGIPDVIQNIPKVIAQIPGAVAKTGANIQWIALFTLALALIGIFFILLKRRSRSAQDQVGTAQHLGRVGVPRLEQNEP